MVAMSSISPYNLDNCMQLGTFTSFVILHVGLFALPLLLQNQLVSLYWVDNVAWEVDLDIHDIS